MKTIKPADITSTVMDEIKNGGVQMRPKLYFTLLAATSTATVILSAVSITYLTSIVFFWMRVQNADTLARGARANLNDAIASFPWWAAVAVFALLIFTTFLIKQHGHLYRLKTGLIVTGLVTASLLIGFGLTLTSINPMHSFNGKPTDSPQQRGAGWRQ